MYTSTLVTLDLTVFCWRYEMTGSDQEDDFTLQIYPVRLEDDAVFQCQVRFQIRTYQGSGYQSEQSRTKSASMFFVRI